jgi:hypothetical protein
VTPMVNTLIFLGESASHESGGTNPWVIGGVVLGLLVVLLLAVIAFGGGREHS